MSVFDIKMATDDKAPKRGAPKKDKPKLLRLAVSPRLYAYLTILRNRTLLGGSENDVANFLLTQRLEAMRDEGYHVKHAVPEEPEC